jgi:hypothetical protein
MSELAITKSPPRRPLINRTTLLIGALGLFGVIALAAVITPLTMRDQDKQFNIQVALQRHAELAQPATIEAITRRYDSLDALCGPYDGGGPPSCDPAIARQIFKTGVAAKRRFTVGEIEEITAKALASARRVHESDVAVEIGRPDLAPTQ